jgi:hypothetical protein
MRRSEINAGAQAETAFCIAGVLWRERLWKWAVAVSLMASSASAPADPVKDFY